LFLVNQEWRVPVWKSLKGVLFYDAGNVYPTASDIDPLDLRHVLGAGLRLDTPIGPIRLEYGYKLDRREGESAGEFFVAIGNPF
jgi:outer membrane protein assembly factor BamA